MSRLVSGARPALALGLLLTWLAACDNPVEAPLEPNLGIVDHLGDELGFQVYTQNFYLGGETAPLFTIDLGNIPALLQATNVFWAQVQASDVSGRAAEIVERIGRDRPHVVALQEVLQFAVLDASFQPIGGLDLLGALASEITARGLPYETAVVQATTSSALPLGTDGVGITQWLSFTDRLVTLRRTDVDLVATDGGVYAAGIPLAPSLTIRRGWTRTTVDFAGTPHHVFNTHLETQAAPPVQAAQTAELIGSVLPGFEGVTVVAGDLNSNAAADPSDPTWTPTYGDMIEDGFIDVWSTALHHPSDQGLTCCHPASLVGEMDFTQRIDFVLARSSDDERDIWRWRRPAFRAEIVGEELLDLTDAGMWPSDHAGLVATMRLPWTFGQDEQAGTLR